MSNKMGRIVLDLPPAEGNPRNSEGAFIDLKNGSLLFVYSRFNGENHRDDARAYLAARISVDQGESWSDEQIIVTPDEHQASNVMSVSLMRMGNEDIGLFYVVRYGFHDTRLFLRRSSDEGNSWGEPKCCIPGPGYYVTNNDRVIRLSSGRLIIPTSMHKLKGENRMSMKEAFDSRGVACFILSDDDGDTWREAHDLYTIPARRSRSGLQELGAIELANGVVWSWSRTDMGCQYEMFSTDGGETWSLPTPSQFTSPRSPLSMKRIPHSGNLLAVWNPIPNYVTRSFEKHTFGRTPYIGAISRDEGKTWISHFTIESDPDRGYCYTAIHFTHDSVILAYCAGGAEDLICLARLRVRKIALADIDSLSGTK